MYIVYYDESGDDGLPGSSDLFVLTATYIHDSYWKSNFDRIREFRRQLKETYNFDITLEFHSKYFMLNKKAYRYLRLTDKQRIQIIDNYCDLIGSLNCRIVNTVINKSRISDAGYQILDRALTYSIQRIENDLDKYRKDERFLIITDPGREGSMKKTARKIRHINPIPSKINQK